MVQRSMSICQVRLRIKIIPRLSLTADEGSISDALPAMQVTLSVVTTVFSAVWVLASRYKCPMSVMTPALVCLFVTEGLRVNIRKQPDELDGSSIPSKLQTTRPKQRAAHL